MDVGFGWSTTRWFGHLWLARLSGVAGVAVVVLARYFGNIRFVPVAIGLFIFAVVCYFEHGRRVAAAVPAAEPRSIG